MDTSCYLPFESLSIGYDFSLPGRSFTYFEMRNDASLEMLQPIAVGSIDHGFILNQSVSVQCSRLLGAIQSGIHCTPLEEFRIKVKRTTDWSSFGTVVLK